MSTPSNKGIIPGTTTLINFRDIEEFMKCPLRHYFNQSVISDFKTVMHRALDATLRIISLKLTVGTAPTKDKLESIFIEKYEEILASYSNISADTGERCENRKVEGISIVRSFADTYEALTNRYTFISPAAAFDCAMNGVTIRIYAPFFVSKKTNDNLAQNKKLYIIPEYDKDITRNLNSYNRLWGAMVLRYLATEKMISSIDVAILNVPRGTLHKIGHSSDSMVTLFQENITRQLASHSIYPVYGRHCHSCLYQVECGTASSF